MHPRFSRPSGRDSFSRLAEFPGSSGPVSTQEGSQRREVQDPGICRPLREEKLPTSVPGNDSRAVVCFPRSAHARQIDFTPECRALRLVSQRKRTSSSSVLPWRKRRPGESSDRRQRSGFGPVEDINRPKQFSLRDASARAFCLLRVETQQRVGESASAVDVLPARGAIRDATGAGSTGSGTPRGSRSRGSASGCD